MKPPRNPITTVGATETFTALEAEEGGDVDPGSSGRALTLGSSTIAAITNACKPNFTLRCRRAKNETITLAEMIDRISTLLREAR
jgi:hypothetical protein